LVHKREDDQPFRRVLGVAVPDKPAGYVRFQTIADRPHHDIIKKVEGDFLPFSPRQPFQSKGDEALAKNNRRIHGLRIQLQRSCVGTEKTFPLISMGSSDEEEENEKAAGDGFLCDP